MFNPFFIFATGIEGSCPTIGHSRTRIDQMAKSRHYELWRRDFDLVEELGISVLRYGPPLHRTFVAPDHYDWDFADATFSDLRRRDIVPIADLCHFGVPDWIGEFQNPDFPDLFAAYARAFATRFPWVQLYTPVNEMYVCALFSARHGWWNEQLTTDLGFVTALKHIVAANILASRAILDVRPDAIFIQSESSEYFHADDPTAIKAAEIMNLRRFLSLDLNYGRPIDARTYEYLLDNGMTTEEYRFFTNTGLRHHCILGCDYYMTNEHRVRADGSTYRAGDVLGYDQIARQYHERYGLPIMHTETNISEGEAGDEAVKWLWKQWSSLLNVRKSGIPTLGFTWYSLIDQVDWDVGLRHENGRVNPVGLFDMDRNIRAVGTAYKKLISEWQHVLPAHSVCLTVPIVLPGEYDELSARKRRDWMRQHMHQNRPPVSPFSSAQSD